MGTAGAKVTVASKLPMKLELQLCQKRVQKTKTRDGMYEEDVYYKTGQIVIINGTAYPNGMVPEGMPPRPGMMIGAALTHGVDKDFFDQWLAEHAEDPIVKGPNGERLVWAYGKADDVKAVAKDNKATNSGLGPLGTDVPPGAAKIADNDRRLPKRLLGRQARAQPESDQEE